MAQWQGFDILETEPNRLGPLEDNVERDFVLLDSRTGKRWADELTAAPAMMRPFVWTAFSRAQAQEMREFLDARKGRAIPFWLPSWQQDLGLRTDAIQAQTILELEWVRYTQLMFPDSAARRHLRVFGLGEAPSYHYIDDAEDPGDWIEESITITPGAPRDLPAATTTLSFLRLCRLEDDEVEVAWESRAVAHAILRVREIPNEAPYVI